MIKIFTSGGSTIDATGKPITIEKGGIDNGKPILTISTGDSTNVTIAKLSEITQIETSAGKVNIDQTLNVENVISTIKNLIIAEKDAGDTAGQPTENPPTDSEKSFVVTAYGTDRETPVDSISFAENTLFSVIISKITADNPEDFAKVVSFNTVADGSGTEIKSTSTRKLTENTSLYAIYEEEVSA